MPQVATTNVTQLYVYCTSIAFALFVLTETRLYLRRG